MLNYILEFIFNNIFYIVPILGIFTVSSIYSTKARSLTISLTSIVILVGLIFIINHYSNNNETLRSILVTIITLFCNVFQLVVYAFILNVAVFQLAYSLGLYDMCYNLAFDIVVSIIVSLIHLTFSIKGFFKKNYLHMSHYIMAVFSYAKKIILDSIFGSFYQVMRN